MPINPSPAVQRAGQVLWYLAEHPTEAHSVAKLARELSIPRATCDSILQALAQQGFAMRRERELGYELGASCLALATAARTANTALSTANRVADALARELEACVVVSALVNREIRPIAVFDRAARTIVPIRVGYAIPLTPPFGVLFVAWDDDASAAWLDVGRADARPGDVERWSSALDFARDHGYVYSTHAVPDEELGRTVGRALDPDSGTTRTARGELIDLLGHGSYLGSGTEADEPLRLVQVSAPVFGPDGDVAATIMVLGSVRPIPAEEVRALTRRVVEAANAATMQARDLALRRPLLG